MHRNGPKYRSAAKVGFALFIASYVIAVWPTSAKSSGAALRAILSRSEERLLREQPLDALSRGNYSYADRVGDLFSRAQSERALSGAKRDLNDLRAVDRQRLGQVDRIAYDVLLWRLEQTIARESPPLRDLIDVLPLNHSQGLHIYYPEVASGVGDAPFRTRADYEANIRRHRDFARQLDLAISRFREGMSKGIVLPRLTVSRMIEQLDDQLKSDLEQSPYLAPLTRFPPQIRLDERQRLAADTTEAVRDEIMPAYMRLRDFLRDRYLPVARTGDGLIHMPGGLALYKHLVAYHTSLPLSADEVHRIGLAEVARIHKEVSALQTKIGFEGERAAFFKHVRDESRFQYRSADEMAADFREIARRVDLRVREQFATIPVTPLVIRPVPKEREKTSSAGTYYPGTADGARPGIFYFNAYRPSSRSRTESETLYLHEAVPGHHFQISLTRENLSLPDILRFDEGTAFIEGWALYAETLWRELGIETDPYRRFGGLNKELVRALRLVVDTGIHEKGWSRDQAIKYMLENSGLSQGQVVAEVERYIANPGQALSYKIGELTISRLKRRAKQALGARFDPRSFHNQVLGTGALPLVVLEQKVERWVAAGGP